MVSLAFVKVLTYYIVALCSLWSWSIMSKAHGKLFMACDICHELWLSPKFMLPTLGFKECMVVNGCNGIWGGINYRPWVLISCNGGQGGEINVVWKV